MSDSIRTSRREIVERFCRIEEADRSFDLAFWQSKSTDARLQAAWEMVELVYRWKGCDPNEFRLQRSVEAYGPVPS